MKNLEKECCEILRKLISKRGFLQPESPTFDAWDADDAKELLADLICEINASDEIQNAHSKNDWGK